MYDTELPHVFVYLMFRSTLKTINGEIAVCVNFIIHQSAFE